MEREEIENRLRSVISNVLDIEESSINNDSVLIDNLKNDSLDAIQIIMDVEDDFMISITDEEVMSVVVINDLVNIVKSKIDVYEKEISN